ncbi:MAG: ABC transporter ATP-binding protein [Acuticoccus sp.]
MTAPLALGAVTRVFGDGDNEISVLRGVDLTVAPGELVALVAPSGAGKSTLLQIAGLLDKPTSGTVTVGGIDTARMSEAERTRVRRDKVGFVYQFHHLLGDFTARENVALPQRLAGQAPGDALRRADTLLDQLGLAARRHHRPAALSGGERQRVAIARAVANTPALLLADEPTGNLDQETAENVRTAFLSLSRENNLAALVATHNPVLAQKLDRTVTLSGGTILTPS